METTNYEGWTNFETWATARWMQSEECFKQHWRLLAVETLQLAKLPGEQQDNVVSTLAYRLKDEIEDAAKFELDTEDRDELSESLAHVNWIEIADRLLTQSSPHAEPRFPLGRIVTTPGAVGAIDNDEMGKALARHIRGDWGDCRSEDWQANDEALVDEGRLHSVYRTHDGFEFWIITEHDRSVTTVLLPSEY